jgi:hypothetical protein
MRRSRNLSGFYLSLSVVFFDYLYSLGMLMVTFLDDYLCSNEFLSLIKLENSYLTFD